MVGWSRLRSASASVSHSQSVFGNHRQEQKIQKGLPLAALFVCDREADQFENAAIPVIALPKISACTSWVPS